MLFQLVDLGASSPHGMLAAEPLLAAGSFCLLSSYQWLGISASWFWSLVCGWADFSCCRNTPYHKLGTKGTGCFCLNPIFNAFFSFFPAVTLFGLTTVTTFCNWQMVGGEFSQALAQHEGGFWS